MRTLRDECQLRAALEMMVRSRLGSGCAISSGPLQDFANAAMFSAEILSIAGAGPRRTATFRAGRACARAAMKQLGFQAAAIMADASGAPIWPAGFVGSISHTDEFAAAVVARSPPIRGIGIDVERDGPLDDAAMVRIICRPEELHAVHDPSHPANLERGKLLFVAKEAVYKAYRACQDTFLDFQDVSVSLDESTGTFCATLFNRQVHGVVEHPSVRGNFARAEGLFIAIASHTQAEST
jgi:4'-phosphopantetheinyl transferase EntD